jgi:hypothetical protein
MPQMTIYLDDETSKLVQRAARQAGESASKWVADAVRRRARTEWPPDVLSILGSWGADFPDAAALRKGYGKDAKRERL